MLKRLFFILFCIDVAVEMLAHVFTPIAIGVPNVHFVTKPLIVLLLVAYYWQSVSVMSKLFLFALLFCWLGDVSLMFDSFNSHFFMAGLGSFLMAHILLIVFYGKIKNDGEGLNGPQKARAAFPVILMGTGLVTVLYPTLGSLKIPVMIYATALTVMVLRAITRYGFTSSKSFWYVTIGALFFMISDSLLAINKFLQPIAYQGIFVMGTYIAAVYFITVGVIAHESGL